MFTVRDFGFDELNGLTEDPVYVKDTREMTQQGFKRFKRRSRQDLGEELRLGALPDELEYEPETSPEAGAGFCEAETRDFILQDMIEADDELMLPASAIGLWDRLRQVPLTPRGNEQKLSKLVSFFRQDQAARQFDLLRTRLLGTLRERGWSRVAVTAPRSGCGTTFTAVNLALSLSRVPETRTVLLDLNQRNPGVADALDLVVAGDMAGFLAGRVAPERHMVRCGESLVVGATAASDPNAAEILHDAQSAETLTHMCDALEADVVLFDLPAVLEHDDVMAFLPQVDGVLLVTNGQTTTAEDLIACERLLGDQTQLLGIVMNEAR